MDSKICGQCGSENSPSRSYCWKCGNSLAKTRSFKKFIKSFRFDTIAGLNLKNTNFFPLATAKGLSQQNTVDNRYDSSIIYLEDSSWYCPFCGKHNKPHAPFCAVCGREA